MKKAVSLFFIAVITFNTVGYYGVLLRIERDLTNRMIEKVDENRSEIGGNLLLTFPLEYQNAPDSESYERTDGQITYEGLVYRMIKKKIHHNTLYILCIRDYKSPHMKDVMNAYSKVIGQQQPEKQDVPVKLIVSFAKYYRDATHQLAYDDFGWTRDIPFKATLQFFISRSVNPIDQPPRI